MKAVPNGETKDRAVVVFGASIEQVCFYFYGTAL